MAITRLGLHGGPRREYTLAVVVSAAVSGTASSGLTEAQIVAGGETIIITLTNDTWVAAGATFDAQRQNIIDGLDSDQSELTGWNNEVRDNEVVTAVVRTSDTVVTITLSAAAAYDVAADEIITVTVPATALVTSAAEIIASPVIVATADVVPSKKGGRAGRRTRYVVEVDGQFFEVPSIADAQAVLLQARELAEQSVQDDIAKVPQGVTPKPPRVRVKTAAGNQTTSQTLTRDVKRTQEAVNRIYAKAAREIERIREMASAVERKRQQEDDEIIALLL